MKRIYVAIVVILVAALAGGTLYWYFAIFKQPASETTPGTTTKPTPAVGFGSLSPYAKLCSDFKKVEGEISCEEAIRIVTAKYEGIVHEIAQGSNFRKKGDAEGRDTWRIEIIKLRSPVQIKQETFEGVRVFLDRKTGEELFSRYQKAQ